MALKSFKGLLSGAMAFATVLSTIPAVNVTAADIPTPPPVDVISDYELDLYKYGPDLLREMVPGFDEMTPDHFEAVKDLYIDGNYVNWDSAREITYNADGTEDYRYEYKYDPASGKQIKYTYTRSDYSYYYTYEYDSNGRRVRYNSYDKDGNLTSYTTYEYDEKGNTSRSNSYNGNGELTSYTTYERTYYDNGNSKTYSYKSYSLQDGNFVMTYGWDDEYNEYGSLLRDVNYSYDYSKKELYESSRYEYIYDGYTRVRTNYYSKGEFLYYYTSEYKYEEDVHYSYTHYWNPDESKRNTYVYIYKKFGNSWYNTETKNLDANDNVISKEIYERNESGKLISDSYYNGETFAYKYVYEYNDEGLRSKSTYYGSNNTVSSYTIYEYIKNEYFDNGHHVPNFDEYVAPANCTFQYRLYNPNSGEHFYSGSREESSHLTELGWNFEGSGFINPIEGDPVYRLYNAGKGEHIYTMDKDEINGLLNDGWTFDGGNDWTPAFPSAPKETGRPMFRLRNPNVDYEAGQAGAYHFTMSEEERDHLKDIGWIYEGIGWYSV